MKITAVTWVRTALIIAASASAAIVGPRSCLAIEIFASGHGDVGVAYEEGELEFELHLEDAGEAFAPGDAIIRIPATTAEPRPAGTAYDRLGVAAGATIYRLSPSAAEAAVEGAPFLGLATEEIPPHTFTPFPGTNPVAGIGLIRFEMVAVDGPGHFALWQDIGGQPGFETRPDLVGPAFASFGGIDPNEDYFPFPTGIHDHANWAFTAPGNYAITFRASGELLTGEVLESVATYNFHVAPEPSAIWLAAIGAVVSAMGTRRMRRPSCHAAHVGAE
jgi:surface-anchored protein